MQHASSLDTRNLGRRAADGARAQPRSNFARS
jgi:hypothetical protein